MRIVGLDDNTDTSLLYLL